MFRPLPDESEESCSCEGECEEFEEGDRVKCNWYQDGDGNQWYFCKVVSVDVVNRTAHVKADIDGDERKNMSWDWMRNLKYYSESELNES